MQFKINPLTKIIGLSSVLAVGFLFIVLAGALYGNWLTILVGFIFGVAHVPMLITKYYNYQFEDYLDDTGSAPTDVIDFGKFLSSFLVTTGVAFPTILDHCHVFTHTATVLTIIGGLLIYGTVVTFTTFFDGTSHEDDPFDI
ncbi:unnamed protein product [[Candida] boidinii]|uniref:Unnamed protein product n=1 Tax=Candida boidinii TaxID=5477 RepID=A0A9W6TA96_CANBO|nr:unnamed protein product [[Candida] boidinii]GME96225.1 unnamed protein product [[Candida] boidinii]GMF63824.1 unnamed protein product [[Candida] boidinii]GMG05313.1 unnamed protein product [[Candida] boidinii]